MSLRALLLVVVAVAAPWAWFLVRDALPIMEVLAIVIPLIGAVAGVAAAVLVLTKRGRRHPILIAGIVSLGLMTVTATVAPRAPRPSREPDGDTVYLVSANLATDNPAAAEALRDLAGGFPDVIVTVETSNQAILALEDLRDEYPFVALGEPGVKSRVVVYSHYPITALPRPPEVEFAQVLPVEVETQFGTFTLFASHLPRPWFTGAHPGSYQAKLGDQQAIVSGLADVVNSTAGPVVIAGDLNLTDRGRGYRAILEESQLTDVILQDWAGSTSLRWWPLALRIDHVLTGHGMCGASPARLDLPGSDHRGLWVEIGPCPPV